MIDIHTYEKQTALFTKRELIRGIMNERVKWVVANILLFASSIMYTVYLLWTVIYSCVYLTTRYYYLVIYLLGCPLSIHSTVYSLC